MLCTPMLQVRCATAELNRQPNISFAKRGSSNEPIDTGRTVRAASVAEGSWIYSDGDLDAGTWDWRKCSNLHAGECCAAQEPAGHRPQNVGPGWRPGRLLCQRWYAGKQ